MKAAVRDRYGSPDVVELADVERPIPGDDEVLVRVRAASVNRADLDGLDAAAALRPRCSWACADRGSRGSGLDVAGVVEAVGPGVTRFRPGDQVFGDMYP